MTKISAPAVALALSAFVTAGTIAAANGLASRQYATAERTAQAYELTHLSLQRVEVVGHPAYQRVVIVGHTA